MLGLGFKMKSVRMMMFGILILGGSSAMAYGGCPSPAEMATHLNEKTGEVCGVGKITWNLSNFVPDGTICESRQQGLNLIKRVVQDLCESKISGDDITTKLSAIEVSAYLGSETEYKYSGKSLIAKVPIKEAAVLTKWNDELEKLKVFLRTSTGLSLASKNDRDQIAKQVEAEKQDKQRQKEKEADLKKSKDLEQQREAEQAARTKKIEAAKSKLQSAVETYQKKAKEIWSRPDNSPEGLEKKKVDADAALKELNRAQADFQKEVSEIK